MPAWEWWDWWQGRKDRYLLSDEPFLDYERFASICVGIGLPDITQRSTFSFHNVRDGADRFIGTSKHGEKPFARIYTRLGNPTTEYLEKVLFRLDCQHMIDKALELARLEPDAGNLERTYGEKMMPALAALERDRQSGELDDEPARVAMRAMSEIVDTLALDHVANAPAERRIVPRKIVLLPAHTEADSITARMLMHVAISRGHDALALPLGDLTSERAAAATRSESDVICICAMPPLAEAHARLLIERMRDGLQPGQVVVALWQRDIDARARARLEAIGARAVVASFDDAIRTLVS